MNVGFLTFLKLVAVRRIPEFNFSTLITSAVVLKDNNSHSYEATPSKLRELGYRLREEWREWLEEISKNNTIQESLDLEVYQTAAACKSHSKIPTKILTEPTRNCQVSIHVRLGKSFLALRKLTIRNSFLSKLESLTKEELMRFFVSHNLSLQYFDMVLVDDGFSWLGSSTLYHLDKPASFGETLAFDF